MAASARGTSPVEYELRIEAAPETVFSYLTDPSRMVRWMGIEAVLDPRPGGVCRIVFEMTREQGTNLRALLGIPRGTARPQNGHVVMSGEFVEVDPPRRVVFTWGWEQEMLVLPPQSSEVDVTLTAQGEATLLRLVHRRLPTRTVPFHREGWEHYLPRLVLVAGDTDPGPDPWQPATA